MRHQIEIVRLIEAGTIAVALLLQGGPTAVAAVIVCFRLSAIVIALILLKRYASWLHYGFARARWSEIRRLLVPSLAAFGVVMGNATMTDGVTLVLTYHDPTLLEIADEILELREGVLVAPAAPR